jgi:lysophospholipase L1-like esterase
MVPHPAPKQTAPADGRGVRPAPRRRTSAVRGTALVAATLVGATALRDVRRLRAAGGEVAALDHRLDLPGTAPARRVAVLGDSAAAGHGLPSADVAIARRLGRALHATDGRATHVRSVARDGARTADVLAEQLPAAAGAELIVVGIGVNDAIRRTPLPVLDAQLRELLVTLRVIAARRDAVVVLGCPDLSMAPGVPPVLRPLLGWRCRAVARLQAAVAGELAVPLVPADRGLLTREVFGPDGFHPGAVGHELLAAEVLRRVSGRRGPGELPPDP